MALNSTHPSYDAHVKEWVMMRTAYAGEGAVKAAGMEYLAPTPGQVLDGATKRSDSAGFAAYEAYKMRAVFPDYVSDAVERYIGMLHQKPATIELPTALEPLLEKATQDGESLQNLLRRINEQQLVTGRLGLMLDLPAVVKDTATALPYIAVYSSESIRNWDNSADHKGINSLVMVVLDESGPVRQNDFVWTTVEQYRVLELLPPTEGAAPVYMQGVFRMGEGSNGVDPSQMLIPMYRGQHLEQLPFVFINSKDIVPEPDNPPLIGLGRTCMSIYRGEADYRHTLFMQGQDTLVTIGTMKTESGDPAEDGTPIRVGAGAHINMDLNGDAKYIGIGAEGLGEQRSALENDRKVAESKAGTLISPAAGKQESGDALTTRLAAQTASLMQIAKTGAAGLENILKIAAVWVGANPDEVSVTPNLEFAVQIVSGQELAQLMGARTMGFPISLKSLHGVAVDRGLTKMTYEDEVELIAEEELERAKLTASLPVPPAQPAPAPARE